MSIVQVTTRDTQLEKQRLGLMALSLTEFDSTDEPAIAAGSVVEIGGSLFEVTEDEAITGWAGIGNDTDCYIKMVVGASVTVAFTTDAPIWSHSKQGWYDGIDRYVGGLHRGATAADYKGKWLLPKMQSNDRVKVIEIGDWDMDLTPQVTIAHGITWSKFRAAAVMIRSDSDDSEVFPLNSIDGSVVLQGGVEKVDATNIYLRRLPYGIFDDPAFDDTSYNRGFVTLWYIE